MHKLYTHHTTPDTLTHSNAYSAAVFIYAILSIIIISAKRIQMAKHRAQATTAQPTRIAVCACVCVVLQRKEIGPSEHGAVASMSAGT